MQSTHVMRYAITLSIMVGGVLQGECLQDGMNLWQLAQCIACSVGPQYEITQDNYTATITTPGHYKLCQNIGTPDNPTTLTINADDVILDLGGFVTNGVTIQISRGHDHVTIRNGTMTNTVVGITIFNGNNILVENLFIEDIIPNPSNPNHSYAIGVGTLPINNLTIRNVAIFNGGYQNIFLVGVNALLLENISCVDTNSSFSVLPIGSNAIIYLNNCNEVEMKNVSLADQASVMNGIWFDTCTDVQVNDVSITTTLASSDTTTPNAYQLSNCTSSVNNNIFIDGNLDNFVFNDGIVITSCTATTLSNCEIYNCEDTGIAVSTSTAVHTNDCYVYNCANGYTLSNNCAVEKSVAEACGNGFTNLELTLLKECVALSCTGDGFQVKNNCFLENCTAEYSGANGYNALPGFAHSIFVDCIANNSTGNGFSINGTELLFDSCISNFNQASGFNVQTIEVGCVIINSTANYNVQFGMIVNNVTASSAFEFCNPIGATSAFYLTSNNNTTIARSSAMNNVSGQIEMAGIVTDRGAIPCSPPTASFILPILPPIGIVNVINGAIYPVNYIQDSSIVYLDSSNVAGTWMAALDGNLVVGSNIVETTPINN